MDTQVCSTCRKDLPLSKFHRYLLRDSYHGECIDCAHARGATLRSQPGYNVWANCKRRAKKNGIRYDEYAFSSYVNFWDTFGEMWEQAQQQYPGRQLTIRRNDPSRGFFVTNCRVVPSRIQPNRITRTIEPTPIQQPILPIKPQSEKLHDVILNALSKSLKVSTDEIQRRIDLGWSLDLLEQVGDNDNLARLINKAMEKNNGIAK